jgi:hypothetical protein
MKSVSSDYQFETVTPAQVLPRRAVARNAFLLALLISTAVPMIFFIWIGAREPVSYSLAGMKTVLLFLGTAHVPATLFFYADKDFAGIIRNNKLRYVYLPILITLFAGFLVVVSNQAVLAYLFIIFWAWQAYHYGRQNVGVYAFASIAQRGQSPAQLEKLTIELGTFCGVLATFKLLGSGVAPSYLQGLFTFLFELGRYGFLVVLLMGLYVYARHYKETTLLMSVFFFTLPFFFLPIYLSDNINATFFSYAIAHGMQYIVFTAVASSSLKRDETTNHWLYGNALKLAAFILLGGLLFYFGGNVNNLNSVTSNWIVSLSINFLVGAVLGATMAHFIIDADAWRLSKAPQRRYMSDKFSFLFEGKRPQPNPN